MNFKEKLQLAYKEISRAKRILIVGHIFPDADALASIGAMIEVSQNLGIEIYAYGSQKALNAYDFIPNENKVSRQAPINLDIFDVILILDCGQMSRTNLQIELSSLLKKPINSRPYIIEFDHHVPQEAYADLEIRYSDKASTTEIIYHFLKENNLEISKTLADCILIGLVTDTGNFFHSNVSREALSIASEMLLLGASLPKIINHTIYNRNFISLKIWGRVLENMVFNADTGFIVSALTKEELSEFVLIDEIESQADLFGDIVAFLNSLSGVRVALLLREKNGEVKGSLRTNLDDIDVAKIANQFGGGGHKKAAGFSIKGKLKRTKTGWNITKI